MNQRVPVIALVGRPNVGKSTLFNRLTKSRDALVANIPGLTRDRHYSPATIGGRRVVVIDTGGFEPVAAAGVAEQMARQTRQAVIEADLVIFVVDGRQGLTARDEDIAQELRRTARRVVVVVNKTEGISRPLAAAEFHALGLGHPMAISAAHGDGVHAMIETCMDDLAEDGFAPPPPEEDESAGFEHRRGGDGIVRHQKGEPTARGRAADDVEALSARDADELVADRRVRVAIVGRPNSGKSTLINALLGEERLIAFDEPGTTRDAIAVDFRFDGRDYQLIDTAGLRRRGKVFDTIEKFSVVKTLQSIEVCNVAVLMIDAVEGVSEQDAAIAGYVLEAGRALVIALNKWDAVPVDRRRDVVREFERKLYFLDWAPMLTISALKRRSLDRLMKAVDEARDSATRKLSTPKLTRMMQAAVQHQPPPRQGPFRPKMRYAHQGGQNPPVIVIHGNALDRIGDSYRRYLEGWFRERLVLQGTPLRIEFRSSNNPYAPRPRR